MKACKDCEHYYDGRRPNGYGGFTEERTTCRRNPPTLHTVMEEGYYRSERTLQALWPAVGSDQWCGEFSPNGEGEEVEETTEERTARALEALAEAIAKSVIRLEMGAETLAALKRASILRGA